MSKYDEARDALMASIKRIIGGATPIDFIGMCDFSKSIQEKGIVRVPRDTDVDIIPKSVDMTHIKKMASIERLKFLEDPYVETRYEKSKGDIIAWHPVGKHSIFLVFAARATINQSDFEFAVDANLEELDTEVKAVLDALTARS